jgi:serine/threonine protein kinase
MAVKDSADLSVSQTRTLQKPAISAGKTLADKYKIIEEIGRGGMGVVYKATDTRLDRTVALKFLSSELTQDEEAKQRFVQEAKAAAALNHPNISTIYEIDEHQGQTLIAMEFIQGQSLKQRLEEGPIEIDEANDIALQVAEGLKEAHDKGIVHRDIKPANIMLTEKGQAKITDFGLAKLSGGADLTKASTIMGTVAYMSPEQARGEEVDHRTDIWSLGAMLYEMLTGTKPFAKDHEQALIYSILNDEPKPIASLRPGLPSDLDRKVQRAIAKAPSMRYQSAEELIHDLRKPSSAVVPSTEKSIAVLPFKDMSPQKDQDYFCEGLAEELINALTQVKDLKVAARTSSFSFKGKEEDIRKIGRILSVGTILEGSVQKSGNRLRITTQLIDVSDGYHLWAERFDRTTENIFAIQDEISSAVVNKLKGELREEDKEKITKRHTADKDALNLFLKGRYLFNRRYQGDMIKAVDFFQRAIDKDPGYALPYVGISDVFNILGLWAFVHPKEAYIRSKAMLQKAIELDQSLSEAYSSLAFMIMGYEWDYPAARKHLLRSIELNPRNAMAHSYSAQLLAYMGIKEEAVAEAQKAVECDPLFSVIQSVFGAVLAVTGRVEEGREQLDKAISMDPEQPLPYLFLGMTCLLKPSIADKAVEYLQKSAGFGMTFAYGWLGAALALAGRRDEALKILEKMDRIEQERDVSPFKKLGFYMKPGLRHFRFMKRKYVAPLTRCIVYLALNKKDEALAWLEKAGQDRDYYFPILISTMDNLDFVGAEELPNHPRIKALRKEIKFG